MIDTVCTICYTSSVGGTHMKPGKYLVVDVGGLFGATAYTVKTLSEARKKIKPQPWNRREWKIFRSNEQGHIVEIGLNGKVR